MIPMRRIFGAALTLAAMAFAPVAVAQTPGCKFRAGGFAYTVVEDSSGVLFRYRLSSRSDEWRIDSFGHHATAMIYGPGVRGAFGIGDSKLRNDEPYVEINRGFFTFYEKPYHQSVEKAPPTRIELAEGFKGWVSRVAAFKKDDAYSHDVVNIVANDGCASLFVRFELKPDASIDGLFSSLVVSKALQRGGFPFREE